MLTVWNSLEFTMRSQSTVSKWLRRLFLSVPGMEPGARKRNMVVLLLYLLLFGLLISLFSLRTVMMIG